MVIEISVAVIALVFVVLGFYTVSLMKTIKQTMLQANQSIAQIQQDLVAVSNEATHVMQDANLLIKDVQHKMHAFDPLLASVNQTGEMLNQLTGSAKQLSAAVLQVTGNVNSKVSDNKSRISDYIEMAKAGIRVWQKIQSIRQSYSKNHVEKKE